MTTRHVSAKFGSRIRLVRAVMVAVVASLTLHHGAMARVNVGLHEITSSHHEGDACAEGTTNRHSMPACCGMGPCLAGIPVGPGDPLGEVTSPNFFAHLKTADPYWMFVRIDRPPKDFHEFETPLNH